MGLQALVVPLARFWRRSWATDVRVVETQLRGNWNDGKSTASPLELVASGNCRGWGDSNAEREGSRPTRGVGT